MQLGYLEAALDLRWIEEESFKMIVQCKPDNSRWGWVIWFKLKGAHKTKENLKIKNKKLEQKQWEKGMINLKKKKVEAK